MPVRRKNSVSWAEQQPKYVEIPPSSTMNQDTRPPLEKMISCDFSVEESFTTDDTCEQDVIKTICGFPKKPARDLSKYPAFSSSPWFDFTNEEDVAMYKKIALDSKLKCFDEEKQATLEKLDNVWKVGAVESEKSRSPSEHDDRDEPKSTEGSNVDLKNDEGSSFLEDERHACTENLEVEVQFKDKDLAFDAGIVICENHFQAKKKPTGRKKKKGKSPFKRQSIGKKKRNKWVILCDEEPRKPIRKKKLSLSKKTCSTKACRKQHGASQCNDSGVSSGSSYNSGNDSGDSGSQNYDGKNGGEGRGGGSGGGGSGGSSGGGFHRNGGRGGAGRDDDSEEKRPFSSGDTEMKDEEDAEGDVKMKSKGSSNMDCEDDSLEQHSVEWQSLPFKTQLLQHSCYCSKNEDCDRPLCVQMKKELKHFKEKFDELCARCQKFTNLLKMHAATCQRPGCRVPSCLELRAKKKVQPPQVPKEQNNNVQRSSSLPPLTDGRVLYWNSPEFPKMFQENINYIKGQLLGKGANGNVFDVYFQSRQPMETPMVVKETHYPINKEEIDVYKSMRNHENIVRHYGVTIKGCEKKMAVFMEKCDKSLFDICDKRAMDTNEAMFYWTQVLAAVAYLHGYCIIHKDIKAKNIMLSELPGQGEHCRAKLADFDSAKKLEAEFTQSGLKPMGTRGFAAPEVLEKKPHGRPADMYSMGCLLLELHGIIPKEDLLPQQLQQLYDKDPNQAHLVGLCVQQEPCNRPTANQLMNSPYVQEFIRIPDQL